MSDTPFIPALQPLQPAQHQTHGWKTARDALFLRQVNLLPAQAGEMGAWVPHAPLAFARLAEDRYTLVLLSGFADGRNQLVDEQGRWLLPVLPLEMQVYPFALQAMPKPEEGTQPQFTLCFNHASGLYRETPDTAAGERRFFTDEGQPQPVLQTVIKRLQQLVAQQQLTRGAVAALQQHELLVPWQIAPREGHPDELLPKGLCRIDEARLNALKGEALETLHQVHALALAYGQLLSMNRISVLQRLKDMQAARSQAAAAAKPDLAVVEQMFGLGQSDTLKFNF